MRSAGACVLRSCLVQTMLAGMGVLAGSAIAQAQSGDPAAGRQKAQACAVCHGPLGISSAPDAPNLAAQPALYVAAQLRAYRSGERKHEVMAVMSRTLTDADIDNVAAWFSSLQIEVKPLP